MKLLSRRRPPADLPGVTGPARVGRRAAQVVRRATAGDVVVIDHPDLDRSDAEALLRRGVVAVVNAAPFISGRYPNLGPQVLAGAGVLLVDQVGPGVFHAVQDGRRVRISEGAVYDEGRAVATGRRLSPEDVQALMEQARAGLVIQLESFAHHTAELLRREPELWVHGQGVPQLAVPLAGRPAVVVERDLDHVQELRGLRRFIAEQRPVLIGVDAGADALLDAGLQPALVVLGPEGLTPLSGSGSDRVVSDRALSVAQQVVVQTGVQAATATGRTQIVNRLDRLDRLGVRPVRIAAEGSAADLALQVADVGGAALIVTVGGHVALEQFLDRQRTGLATSFLTSLRVGPRLVDARLVPTLYTGRVRPWQLVLSVLLGLVAVGIALITTPVGADWFQQLPDAVGSAWDWLRDRITGVT